MDDHAEVYEAGYYVYGLIDPKARRETGDDLLSIFYIGKGKDLRWSAHEVDVRKTLKKAVLLLERYGSKAQRIRKILERGESVPAIRLSAGYPHEKDAYRAESLAIDLVSALLSAAGRPPLTNASPGHHAGFISLGDHFKFVAAEQLDVAPSGHGSTALLVKGTSEELPAGGHRLVERGLREDGLDRWRHRIKVLSVEGAEQGMYPRRGWDPDNPWDDSEARERGRRYWPLSKKRVLGWLGDPSTMPQLLLLGIPLRGETVVRYVWEIDPNGEWEYFPEMKPPRWGIPLGRRVYNHETLGKSLYEERNGERVQVLKNRAAGWGELQL